MSADFSSSYANQADGLFAGIYGNQTFGGWSVGASLSGGHLAHSSDRFVNDNLSETNGETLGLSSATADYNSWWFSPTLKVARDISMDSGLIVTPSVQAMYASQFMDGYGESGSAADADIGSYNVSVGEVKAELATSKRFGDVIWSSHIGYRYLANLGDGSVAVGMIGETQNIPFFFENSSAAYAGVSMNLVPMDSMKLTVSANGMVGENLLGGSVRGRLGINF